MGATDIRSDPDRKAPPEGSQVAAKLLAHYDRHARRLPWRAMPGEPPMDAYKVWLSEIMLQQTTVAAVIPYFERFTARWPTVQALANADDADLMAAWAGLGYYARARNLLACARLVANERSGRFPEDEATLRTLPGIGTYTAAAISAIAFGLRAVVLDGNVERVVARLAAIDTPLPAAKKDIAAVADSLTPHDRAGDFAQAMMDLGATICTPRSPDCPSCPIAEGCQARALGNPADYPVKAPKKVRPTRHGTAWWVEAHGQVWIVRRPEKGLLGGMNALPASDWEPAPVARSVPLAGAWRIANQPVVHVFTHFRLDLMVARLDLSDMPDPATMSAALGEGRWWPVERLAEAGFPALFSKASDAARALAPQGKCAA